jgi:hypothetical protein
MLADFIRYGVGADFLQSLQARLELQLQQLQGEAQATARQLELLTTDIGAERDRVVMTKALLERKVMRAGGTHHVATPLERL